MKKVKIQRKLSKNQKTLLIGLLIGDGTICSNYVFKLSHSNEQLEYLKWKIKLLNDCNIKTNGIKKYISKCGFNTGKEVIYSQLAIIPTIKALRRSVYIPNKTITRKLLNWLTEREIAIWYMDDGYININQSKQRSSIQYTIKISTCVDKNTAKIIIMYFKEKWDIDFSFWEEKQNKYSIRTASENDVIKFIKIVKPYILQVPSLLYKIRKNITKDEFLFNQNQGLKCETF